MSDPRDDPRWQRTVESAVVRGDWPLAWTLEDERYRATLSPYDRRRLEQEAIDALDRLADVITDAEALRQQRILDALHLRPRHGPDPDTLAPAAEVRAERDRRMATGEPYGYDALARDFGCSARTIARRLGRP